MTGMRAAYKWMRAELRAINYPEPWAHTRLSRIRGRSAKAVPMTILARRRTRRIERLEIATGMHDAQRRTFTCPCGQDVTQQVRRKMLDRGRFCDGIVGICPDGHYAEYWLDRETAT